MESQLINTEEEEEEILILRHEKELKRAADDEKRPNWANLQSDARNLVFSHLHDFDWIRFRLTCKEWQSAINVSEDLSTGRIPWLMLFSKHSSHGVFDFFHPISNETYTMQILELAGCNFHCSRYGWVLVSRGNYSLFFFNPFIPKSTIKLPDLPGCKDFISISFTAPPTSPDCIVFAYAQQFYMDMGTLFKCCQGQPNWDGYDIHLKQEFHATCCTPVSYQGIFYQLDINGRLGTLDPTKVDDEYSDIACSWEDLPKPTGQNVTYHNCYIAECDGDLVSVFVGRHGSPIHILKLDWSTMEWVMMESLGNKTMFVHKTGSLLVKTNGDIQNKIYFPKFRNINAGDNTKIRPDLPEHNVSIFYSLETHRYHGSGTDFSSENWTDLNGSENCVWIQPNVNNSDQVEDNWFIPFEDSDDDDSYHDVEEYQDDQSDNNGNGNDMAEEDSNDS